MTTRSALGFLMLSAVTALVACGRAPREAPDEWSLPVTDAVPVIEVPAASPEGRVAIVGALQSSPHGAARLGIVPAIALDDEGLLYVLEASPASVRKFGRDGVELARWGEQGRAPGQFFGAGSLVYLGNRIGVVDVAAARLSVWTLAGEHVRDFNAPIYRDLSSVISMSPDRFLASVGHEGLNLDLQNLSVLNPQGEELQRIVSLPGEVADPHRIFPRPSFAASGQAVYVTAAERYQVHAYDANGTPQWAVRVDWPLREVTDEAVGRSLERSRRAGRAMGENVRRPNNVEYPDFFPALAVLAVDSAGRLYVFPEVEEADAEGRYPVDVYAPDGSLLLQGTLPFQGWEAAFDGEVYRISPDPVNESATIERYRLDLPEAETAEPGSG